MSESLDLELPDDPDAPALEPERSASIDLSGPESVPPPASALPAVPAVPAVLTATLQRGQLEIQFSSPEALATDFLAHSEYHAFLVKDPQVGPLLDEFEKSTAELWEDDVSLRSSMSVSDLGSDPFTSVLTRMTTKWPESRVLLTPKRSLPSGVDAHFNQLVKRLLTALPLSEAERKLAADAGLIHSVVRFRQNDAGGSVSRAALSSYARLLPALHEEPGLLNVLKAMYTRSAPAPAAHPLAAQVLTLVDLFCDRFHPEHALHRNLVNGVAAALGNLTGKLLNQQVLDAFTALLEEDLPALEADDHKNRVLVYTDWLDHIFPLEARLRQENFQAFVTDSLEACPQINRRKHPNIVILRLKAQPSVVIKAIHYLLSHGVTLTETPTFLLVDAQHIDRLTGLLALGIEDILDMHGRLDPVILKMKKVRSRLIGASRSQLSQATAGAGTSGHLEDMNLIDLLQALGPSQRTARVTLHAPEAAQGSLSLYLNKGSIIFAQLGELTGDAAIHRAMGWKQGNWLVEQVPDTELPAPNTTPSNEAILIEGCRLLDESARGSEAGSL
jgi:hypothetical protein